MDFIILYKILIFCYKSLGN